MNDPLKADLRAMRRVKFQRLRHILRNPQAYLRETPVYPEGHDVVDLSTGVRRVVIKAKRSSDPMADDGQSC
jgi:hypothetical protein